MKKDRLLWVDDEIDLLRPHILFLESKGYEVHTVSNGQDALDRCRETDYDLIFLDENMPGIRARDIGTDKGHLSYRACYHDYQE